MRFFSAATLRQIATGTLMVSRRTCAGWVYAVGVLLCLGVPRSAAAGDPSAEAEQLIRRGIELRKAHEDERALREFQKAYKLTRVPRAAGQLGLAEQAVGRWEEAEQHVREALDAPNDPWVTKYHDSLVDAMGLIQRHLGRVEIIGEPEGAEVSVNGRQVGRLPLADPITVSVGEVDIELRAPGYQPGQRTITLVVGQYQRVVLRLNKEPQASAAKPEAKPIAQVDSPPPPPEQDRGVTVVETAREPAKPAPPVEGPSTARTVLKWSAAGLSVASLAVGVTFTILQGRNVSAFDASDNCANLNGVAVYKNTTTPMPLCQKALDYAIFDTKMAVAGYVGAGVFAVTWLILQLTEPSPSAAAPEHALGSPRCAPLAGRATGLECALRF
jgi:hypothetical protein